MASTGGRKVYNANIGVLGHVDSGKTSLVAALSTSLSTAALDKHPQSKERGITLDLGFSSFIRPLPSHLIIPGCEEVQITLVDCPGHASLVRTIIGGAQIIDMMLLVIDVTRGIQAQTAECLVVGEMTTDRMLVVLNKTDLLPSEHRQKLVMKAQKMLLQTFAHTKFKQPPVVAICAKPGSDSLAQDAEMVSQQILKMIPDRSCDSSGPFLMSVDHCFAIKGHGTVLTGTVLQGSAKINEMVELPQLGETKKIKSIQMFKRPQQQCQKGDRVGICVTQLESSRVERGWLCAPKSIPTFTAAVAEIEKIRFYTGTVKTKQKLHITVGHATVMAEVEFFGLPDEEGEPLGTIAAISTKGRAERFDFQKDYFYQDELYGAEGRLKGGTDELPTNAKHHGRQWGLLRFSQPVTAPQNSLVIGSRLDSSSSGSSCRLAMYGCLKALIDPCNPADLHRLRVFKLKKKEGVIERYLIPDGRSTVCKGLFKKESDFSAFIGLKVYTKDGYEGSIEGSFGKSGKFKVQFKESLPPLTPASSQITLTFKKYMYNSNKSKILQ